MTDDQAPDEVIDLTHEERTSVRLGEADDSGTPGASDEERVRALEAVLFVATEPLSTSMLAALIEADRETSERLLATLSADYERRGAGLSLRQVAGGWRLSTHPAAAPVVERFVLSSRHARLTKASLETLSIVAYKQPVTRHQISAIRGVNSEGVIRALVDRGLVGEVGREEGPGRPVLYGTTPEFLERLGINSVADLPSLAPLLGEDGASGNGGGGGPKEDGASGNGGGGGPKAEQDPAVVGNQSGEPEREEPGDPGPDVSPDPSETETEGVPEESEPEEEPGEPGSPGSPDPDRGSGEEDSPDPDRSGG
jgi:segregation and condensation protein B